MVSLHAAIVFLLLLVVSFVVALLTVALGVGGIVFLLLIATLAVALFAAALVAAGVAAFFAAVLVVQSRVKRSGSGFCLCRYNATTWIFAHFMQ